MRRRMDKIEKLLDKFGGGAMEGVGSGAKGTEEQEEEEEEEATRGSRRTGRRDVCMSGLRGVALSKMRRSESRGCRGSILARGQQQSGREISR